MIASPCINICQMNATSALCLGCFRTLDEIAGWATSDDARRLSILANVERRRQQQSPEPNPAGSSPTLP